MQLYFLWAVEGMLKLIGPDPLDVSFCRFSWKIFNLWNVTASDAVKLARNLFIQETTILSIGHPWVRLRNLSPPLTTRRYTDLLPNLNGYMKESYSSQLPF